MYIFTLLFSFLSPSFYLSLSPSILFSFLPFFFFPLNFLCFFDLSDRFGTHVDFKRKQITEMGEWCLGLSHVFEFVILFHSFFSILNAITIWEKKIVSRLTYLTTHSLLFLLSPEWAHFWGYFKRLILQSLCFSIYRGINQECFTS